MARHVKGNAVSVSVEHVRVVAPHEPDRTRGWFNSQHSIEADMDAADVLKQFDKGQPYPAACAAIWKTCPGPTRLKTTTSNGLRVSWNWWCSGREGTRAL